MKAKLHRTGTFRDQAPSILGKWVCVEVNGKPSPIHPDLEGATPQGKQRLEIGNSGKEWTILIKDPRVGPFVQKFTVGKGKQKTKGLYEFAVATGVGKGKQGSKGFGKGKQKTKALSRPKLADVMVEPRMEDGGLRVIINAFIERSIFSADGMLKVENKNMETGGKATWVYQKTDQRE